MSESNGPKVDIPDELAAELEEQPAATQESHADASDAEKELAELNDKHLRLAAEFDNYKRRTLKEHQDLLNYATENLIKELLGTVDNLERALDHVRQQEEGGPQNENLTEGVELTYRSLLQALEKSGLVVVDPGGEVFDPKVHEAIRQIPSADHAPGSILEVFQKGYLLRDRLLRPALVAVSGPAQDAEQDSE